MDGEITYLLQRMEQGSGKAREHVIFLKSALEDLRQADPPAHQAVVMRAVLGASNNEAMRALNASRSTVSRHLNRGLAFLHATMIGAAVGIERARLQPLLADLRKQSATEYRALLLRAGMGTTLRESAELLGLTKPQVIVAEERALVKISGS